MTPSEIIAQAYSIIDDPDGTIPPAEMSLHLEDVALDFSRRSQVMRSQKAVAYFSDHSILTLPEDCHEIIRVINSRNEEICPVSKAELPYAFENDTSESPEYYTRGYTGPEQVMLYPKPTAGGTLIIYYVQQHVVGQDILIPSRYHLALVYGLASKALARSSNPEDQEKCSRFGTAYEAGVESARAESSADFSSQPRTTPYRHL